MDQHSYSPPWWLKNPHLQTLWASLCRPGPAPAYHRQRLELPDGDFLDLDWSQNPGNDQPLVVILHGLEGSSSSAYVRGIVQQLTALSYQCLVMHFRGCSGTPNRSLRTYHSGETSDLDMLIRWLRKAYPRRQIAVIGYSLGANVLLKWLGEQSANTPVQVGVAVCPPFCLAECAKRLERGFSRLYQYALLRSLKRKVREKYQHRSSPLDLHRVAQCQTFLQFDDAVTAPLHGFVSAEQYYQRSSSRQFLSSIRTPALIICARDDPFMTQAMLPCPAAMPTSVTLEIQHFGGHVGFIAALESCGYGYWLEQRISCYLQQCLT